MAKKKQYFDPRTGTYTDKQVKGAKEVDQGTLTQAEGHGGAFSPVPGLQVTTKAHKASDAFGTDVGAVGSFNEQFGNKPSGTAVGKNATYNPDEMIRTYLPGVAKDPAKFAWVKRALSQHEKGSGTDYHTAISTLIQSNPQLADYTDFAQAFGQAPKPGQLSQATLEGLTNWTQKYQAPLLAALQADSGALTQSLQALTPKLPASYRSLMQTQIPIMQNMPKQIAEMIGLANPGQIANSYAQAYAPAATQTQANALFNGLPGLSS